MTQRYKPQFGIAPPDAVFWKAIDPPLADGDQPVVIAPEPIGRIEITRFDRRRVVMRNAASAWVPFVICIVPRTAVKLTTLPWQELGNAFAMLKSPEGRVLVMKALANWVEGKLRG